MNARLLERVWFFVEQRGPMRADLIHQHYTSTHEREWVSRAAMTQTLLASGMFKRVGWYNRNDDTMLETTLSSKALGIKNAAYVCVIDTKSLDEILSAFREGKRTIRTLGKMPVFVREAFCVGDE